MTSRAPWRPSRRSARALAVLAIVGLGLAGCDPFHTECLCAPARLTCEDADLLALTELAPDQHTAQVDALVARMEALAGRWSVPYTCPVEGRAGSLTLDVVVDASALDWIVGEPSLGAGESYECDAQALGALTVTTGVGPYATTSQRTLTVTGRAYGKPSPTIFSGSVRTNDGAGAATGTLMLVFDESGVLNGSMEESAPPDCNARGVCSDSESSQPSGCMLSAGSRVGS